MHLSEVAKQILKGLLAAVMCLVPTPSPSDSTPNSPTPMPTSYWMVRGLPPKELQQRSTQDNKDTGPPTRLERHYRDRR